MIRRFSRGFSYFLLAAFSVVAIGLTLAPSASAQSLTTGAITGVVTDQTGAVIPGATVTVTSNATGAVQRMVTGPNGNYTASLLLPGQYSVRASSSGFSAKTVGPIAVYANQTATTDVSLQVGTPTQTVEVSAAAPLIQTSNPNTTTTLNAQQLDVLPNPGNDLSYAAQVAPGAVMNTGAGYGNVEFNGLPATATNFTIDGLNANDPFLAVNNSGATNLQLGLNAIQQVTVSTSSFAPNQGGASAAQVNYVSKAGTNAWHGKAFETWNGRSMNAVDWFVNADPTGKRANRVFSNVNQWGGDLGGPIVKNKLFVFGDVEGLNIVVPATHTEIFPSAAFEQYVLTELPLSGYDPRTRTTYAPPANPGVAATYYKRAFSLYGTPSGGVPTPVLDCPIAGDGTITTLTPGSPTPRGTGCALKRVFANSNKTFDKFYKFRVDHDINQNNRVWYLFSYERGVQATYTDAVNPVFNAYSTQPQSGATVGYTHIFSPNLVNEFNPGYYWYSAIFQPTNFPAARAASPFEFRGAGLTPIFGATLDWPQGRNVTDWQLIDNLTWSRGSHTFQFGENLGRDLVSDHDTGIESGQYLNLGDVIQYSHDVVGSAAIHGFPLSLSEPVGLAHLEAYFQDTWKFRPNVTFTYGLRGSWGSDPVSQDSHFTRLKGSFYDISHNVNQPLNSVVQPGLHYLFDATPLIVWQPRASVAWSVKPNTVLRVGAGLFTDPIPAFVADSALENFPNDNIFTAGWAGSGQPITATYAIPGSGNGIAGDPNNDAFPNISAANAALLAGFKSGVLSCAAASAPANCISPAGFFSFPKGKIPTSYVSEWRASLEQQFGNNWKATIAYVGTKATNLPYEEQANGFQTVCQGCFSPYLYDPTFNGPDGRFGGVTQLGFGANTSYNALQTSLQKRTSHGLAFGINYTWSHCIDEFLNGSFLPFSFDTAETSGITPGQLFAVRGNCDYDNRHSFNANWIYQLPSVTHNRFLGQILNGWQISGDFFARTGFPITMYSAGYSANGNGVFQTSAPNFAVPVAGVNPYAKWQKLPSEVSPPEIQWLNPNAFTSVVDPDTGSCTAGETIAGGAVTATNDTAAACQFGAGGRNNLFGPGFWWPDIFISKEFKITERVRFRFDVQFYNAFNHMNPSDPGTGAGVPAISDTLLDAGTIGAAVSPPTSLLGAFLGGDNSQRMIALSGKLEF